MTSLPDPAWTSPSNPPSDSPSSPPSNVQPASTWPPSTWPAIPEPAHPEPANPDPPNAEPANAQPPSTRPANAEPAPPEPRYAEPPDTEPPDTGPAGYGVPPASAPNRLAWRREALVCLAVALGIVALGAPIGLLWRLLAPKVELVQSEGGPYPVEGEPEGYIADDGWFIGIGAVAGVAIAIAAWLFLRRYRGPAMLAAITVGSVGGAVLAAWLGHRVGLAEFQRMVREAPPGTRLYRPVNLRITDVGLWFGFIPRMRGAVLIQAILAAGLYTAIAGFHYSPGLRADAEQDERAWEPTPTPTPTPPPDGPADGPAPVSWDWRAPQDPTGAPAPPVPYAAAPPPDATAPFRRAGD